MSHEKQTIKSYASADESKHRSEMITYLHSCPIPDDQVLSNIGLFIESKNLSRILFMDFLYRQIIDVPARGYEILGPGGAKMLALSCCTSWYI